MKIQIEAVNYIQFDRRKIRSAMGKAARVVAKQLKATAGGRAGSGAIYGRHRASAPGQPPVRYTSNLWRSIKGRASRRGYAFVVQATAPHANLLELGSGRMERRPAFAPTVRGQQEAVQNLLREAWDAGITVYAGQPGRAPKHVEIN